MVFFYEPEVIRKIFFKKKPIVKIEKDLPVLTPSCVALTCLFGVYFLLQLYLPLRHHLYEGDVFYTEEGHRLSWRMMLRYKSGRTTYEIKDLKSDSTWTVKPNQYLTPKQTAALAGHPDMIWQFAQFLEEQYLAMGIVDVEIKAESFVRLNSGPLNRLIDPETDLTKVPWQPFKHAEWILINHNSD